MEGREEGRRGREVREGGEGGRRGRIGKQAEFHTATTMYVQKSMPRDLRMVCCFCL